MRTMETFGSASCACSCLGKVTARTANSSNVNASVGFMIGSGKSKPQSLGEKFVRVQRIVMVDHETTVPLCMLRFIGGDFCFMKKGQSDVVQTFQQAVPNGILNGDVWGETRVDSAL